MGMHARFYVPALVWIGSAAACSFAKLRSRRTIIALAIYILVLSAAYAQQWIPTAKGWAIGRVYLFTYIGYSMAVSVHLLPIRGGERLRGYGLIICTGLGIVLSTSSKQLPYIPSDRDYIMSSIRSTTSWRGSNQLKKCLGEDIHVYHSEIGVPGLMFLKGIVTDLGGLMNSDLAFGKMKFEDLCLSDMPEAIFLPHRNYRTLNREIKQGDCIQKYTPVTRKSSSPLYIRNDRLKDYHCLSK